MTKNEVNVDQISAESYLPPESLFDRKRTKTSHFLLNTIFPNSSLMATEYFVNAFITDEEFKHSIARPVFVLFKTKDKDTKWLQIIQRLRSKEEYVLEYFCGIQDNHNLIMIIFQVPKKYAKEYINFRAGKYSKFSSEYKKTFNRYTHDDKAQPVESTIWRVLHKSPKLKEELETFFTVRKNHPYVFAEDDELWGIPLPKYEHYRFKEPQKEISG